MEKQARKPSARMPERAPKEKDERRAAREHKPVNRVIMVLVSLAALLVAALVTYVILASTPAFTITGIDAEDTEHLSREDIAKLADVEEGTTLLTFDAATITKNLKRNPWVGSVSYKREFPDHLKIEVTERRVDCVVKMSASSVCWFLGEDSVWIEPSNLTVRDGQSTDDVALALAQDLDALFITDVPTSMSPSAGSVATDEVLKAVTLYREEFSSGFAAQIARFSVASTESMACTLKNGVEISLGAPSNIDLKEQVIREILDKHPNQVTYINVRVPSQPTFRKLGVDSVSEGSGVTVDLSEEYSEALTPTEVEEYVTSGTPVKQQTSEEEYYEEDYDGYYDESYDNDSGYYEEY